MLLTKNLDQKKKKENYKQNFTDTSYSISSVLTSHNTSCFLK